jgi:hypothetical protein
MAYMIGCSALALVAVGCRGGASSRKAQPIEGPPTVQPATSPATQPKALAEDPATRTGPAIQDAPNTPPRATTTGAATIPTQPAPEPELPAPFVPANRPPTTSAPVR